jgi:hypothetical protein
MRMSAPVFTTEDLILGQFRAPYLDLPTLTLGLFGALATCARKEFEEMRIETLVES